MMKKLSTALVVLVLNALASPAIAWELPQYRVFKGQCRSLTNEGQPGAPAERKLCIAKHIINGGTCYAADAWNTLVERAELESCIASYDWQGACVGYDERGERVGVFAEENCIDRYVMENGRCLAFSVEGAFINEFDEARCLAN